MATVNLPYAYFGKIMDGDAILAEATRINPTPVPQDIRDLFLYTFQPLNSDFKTHPVILMAIDYMQRQENYTWKYNTGFFSTRSKSARGILFPGHNWSPSPSQFSIDGLTSKPFKDGGVALTVKAFDNSNQGRRINMDKVNRGVVALNKYINDNATALFAEYYRWHCIKSPPSPDLVNQYLSLLLSAPYRQKKLAEFTNGGWINPALEMYNHFVKLKACGATDDQVTNAINQLTQTAPAIPLGGMSGLEPQAWKLYRGWLFSGNLDWSDIHAQNLGEYGIYMAGPPAGDVKEYFCPEYLDHYGYKK